MLAARNSGRRASVPPPPRTQIHHPPLRATRATSCSPAATTRITTGAECSAVTNSARWRASTAASTAATPHAPRMPTTSRRPPRREHCRHTEPWAAQLGTLSRRPPRPVLGGRAGAAPRRRRRRARARACGSGSSGAARRPWPGRGGSGRARDAPRPRALRCPAPRASRPSAPSAGTRSGVTRVELEGPRRTGTSRLSHPGASGAEDVAHAENETAATGDGCRPHGCRTHPRLRASAPCRRVGGLRAMGERFRPRGRLSLDVTPSRGNAHAAGQSRRSQPGRAVDDGAPRGGVSGR